MKLKKIASLMLAGVMAVSMLAGCNGKTEEKPGEDVPEVTPITGAASVINSQLDNKKDQIKFDNDAELEKLLTQWCDANLKKPSDLDTYQDNTVAINTTNVNGYNDGEPVAKWAKDLYGADGVGIASVIKNANTSKKTALEVFIMSGKLLTEENALRLIGQYVDSASVVLPKDGNGGDTSYSYTGSVAAVNAQTKGKTENVWVIGITVTQTPADK